MTIDLDLDRFFLLFLSQLHSQDAKNIRSQSKSWFRLVIDISSHPRYFFRWLKWSYKLDHELSLFTWNHSYKTAQSQKLQVLGDTDCIPCIKHDDFMCMPCVWLFYEFLFCVSLGLGCLTSNVAGWTFAWPRAVLLRLREMGQDERERVERRN